MTHQAVLCRGCAAGHVDLTAALSNTLIVLGFEVLHTDCMSGCARPSTVAFRSAGKTVYLFGDLGPDDVSELIRFAQLYRDSADGSFADARELGGLRMKAIARVPSI